MRNLMNNIEIKSDRFILRTLTEDDVSEKYLGWINKDATKRYITYAKHQRTLDGLRCYVRNKLEAEDVCFLGIFLKDNLFHIGNIKYEPIDMENRHAIMGILIGEKDWHNKGVAPEVIKASAKWLQVTQGIEQIALGVDVENKAAIKAYENVGFIVSKVPYINSKPNIHSMLWVM